VENAFSLFSAMLKEIVSISDIKYEIHRCKVLSHILDIFKESYLIMVFKALSDLDTLYYYQVIRATNSIFLAISCTESRCLR